MLSICKEAADQSKKPDSALMECRRQAEAYAESAVTSEGRVQILNRKSSQITSGIRTKVCRLPDRGVIPVTMRRGGKLYMVFVPVPCRYVASITRAVSIELTVRMLAQHRTHPAAFQFNDYLLVCTLGSKWKDISELSGSKKHQWFTIQHPKDF